MEYIYAALLLHKAGKEVSEENLKHVVAAAGIHTDESKVKSLVTSLKGVDIDKELASASLAVASAGSPSKESGKPEVKEEKKEEKSAPAAEGLSALFG